MYLVTSAISSSEISFLGILYREHFVNCTENTSYTKQKKGQQNELLSLYSFVTSLKLKMINLV